MTQTVDRNSQLELYTKRLDEFVQNGSSIAGS
jgi:hypothetical protein